MKSSRIANAIFVAAISFVGANLALANTMTPLSCTDDNAKPNAQIKWSMSPNLYFDNETLCFDVRGWPDFKGSNCLDKNGNAQWEATTLVVINGDSRGRDHRQFRVSNAKVSDTTISYEVEYMQNGKFYPYSRTELNRLTGKGVDWDVEIRGGTSITCTAGKTKF